MDFNTKVLPLYTKFSLSVLVQYSLMIFSYISRQDIDFTITVVQITVI